MGRGGDEEGAGAILIPSWLSIMRDSMVDHYQRSRQMIFAYSSQAVAVAARMHKNSETISNNLPATTQVILDLMDFNLRSHHLEAFAQGHSQLVLRRDSF